MQFDVLMRYTQKRNETLSVERAVIKIFFVPIECSGEEKKSPKIKNRSKEKKPGGMKLCAMMMTQEASLEAKRVQKKSLN